MKRISILCVLLIFAISAYSQDDRKNVFSLSSGSSITTGDFASTDEIQNIPFNATSISTNGYAKNGVYFNISYQRKIVKYVGAQILTMFSMNTFDTDAAMEQSPGFTVTADPWITGGVMVGPYGYYKLNKFEFNLRLLMGSSVTRKPQVDYRSNGLNANTFKEDFATDGAFAIDFGFTTRYDIADGFGFLFNLDSFSTNPTFNFGDEVGSFSFDMKQKVTLMNVSFGIAVVF